MYIPVRGLVMLKKIKKSEKNSDWLENTHPHPCPIVFGNMCKETETKKTHRIYLNTNHLHKFCTMLDQRWRRWANLVQILKKCFVFAGVCIWHITMSISYFYSILFSHWLWMFVQKIENHDLNRLLDSRILSLKTCYISFLWICFDPLRGFVENCLLCVLK